MKYTVHQVMLECGKPYFEIRNNDTGRVAAHIHDQAEAELHALYMNERSPSLEPDSDWKPGSNRNWWARNNSQGAF